MAALVVGYAGYGWRGVLLGLSVVVFWLLLQFSRALRAMRMAAARPVGQIDNAVMFAARVRPGMTLVQLIAQTKSLGREAAPEVFVWTDGGGDAVRVALAGGRVSDVRLVRSAPAAAAPRDEPGGGHARQP